MGKFIDITGKPFGRLTAQRVHLPSINGRDTVWWCKCECGNELPVRSYSLRKPNGTRSCGCYQGESPSRVNEYHGHTKDYKVTSEYQSWASMKERCLNAKCHQYTDYGAKGISICQEWIDSFTAFLTHIGNIPQDGKRYTLDRIDFTKGYVPGNVRWADNITQANNKKNNIRLTAFGRTMTLMQWSRETGIGYRVIRNRLLCKWDHERIVTQKPRYRDRHKTVADFSKAQDYWCV